MKKKIQKVLVANRGEIAVRVIRACREMGLAAVAVYSEADRHSPHVYMADQAIEIGPPEALQSYLNIERIIAAARETQSDAVHPGYGFLSENADFARACADAGLIFIGPTPAAMQAVGDKLTARRTMIDAGVPVTPGVEIHGQRLAEVQKKAEEIGYPVMVKASAGGGGKGMRIVQSAEELQSAIDASRREAKAAFGDDTVYMEKFIENPRHVEFQVLADQHGNIVHLFERECSIQRRHQKIIEETPSPVLDEELRSKMGDTACRVMEAVGYTNAGTVEFLLDAQKNFYFLEVNARIQVEHPITELVSGVDLIQQQIRIAGGAPLPFAQGALRQRGHAIECRIYAEDPANRFFPSTGPLLLVKEPAGPGIRVDSGVTTGLQVTHFYDPLLAKLIVYAEDRPAALQKMATALNDYVILGVTTNISFLKEVLQHPQFVAGQVDTHFIQNYFSRWQPNHKGSHLEAALVVAALADSSARRPSDPAVAHPSHSPSPWTTLGEWELFRSRKV